MMQLYFRGSKPGYELNLKNPKNKQEITWRFAPGDLLAELLPVSADDALSC